MQNSEGERDKSKYGEAEEGDRADRVGDRRRESERMRERGSERERERERERASERERERGWDREKEKDRDARPIGLLTEALMMAAA